MTEQCYKNATKLLLKEIWESRLHCSTAIFVNNRGRCLYENETKPLWRKCSNVSASCFHVAVKQSEAIT